MGAAEVPQGRRRPGGSRGVSREWTAALALALAFGGVASAQQAISTGTISGVVQDEQGLPVPGALVEVTNAQTREQRSTTSNTTGNFNVPALVIGRYTVRVSLSGFGTVEQVDIQLQFNETYNAGTVTLRAGITETLTVTADPIGVQTTTAVRTSVLDTSTIDTLVSRGRDPVRLLNSLPGVDPNIGGLITGGTIGTGLPTMQGTAGFASYVAIDGIGSADGDTGQQQRHHEHGRDPGDPRRDEQLHRGVRPQHGPADQRRHQVGRAAVFRQPLDLHPSRSVELEHARQRAPRPAQADCPLLHGRRYDRRSGGAARRRKDETHLLLLHPRKVGHDAGGDGQHEADADSGRAHRRLLADDADERHAFFIKRSSAPGRVQCDHRRPGMLSNNVIPADRISSLGRAMLNIFPQPNFFDISVSQRQYNFADIDIPDVYRALDQLTLDHNFTGSDRVSVKYRHWRPNRESTTGTFGINSNWNHFRSQYAQKEDALTVNYTRTLTSQLVSEISFGYRNTPGSRPRRHACRTRFRSSSASPTGSARWARCTTRRPSTSSICIRS